MQQVDFMGDGSPEEQFTLVVDDPAHVEILPCGAVRISLAWPHIESMRGCDDLIGVIMPPHIKEQFICK